MAFLRSQTRWRSAGNGSQCLGRVAVVRKRAERFCGGDGREQAGAESRFRLVSAYNHRTDFGGLDPAGPLHLGKRAEIDPLVPRDSRALEFPRLQVRRFRIWPQYTDEVQWIAS